MLRRIVTGFLSDVDRLDAEAARAGLWRRLALVFETHDAARGEMVYPANAVLAALRTLADALPADRLTVHLNGTALDGTALDGLGALAACYAEADEPEPFERLRFEREGAPLGIVIVRDFTPLGGPPPYHDAVVLVLFHEEADGFAEALHARLGGVPVTRGLPGPRRTWLNRLFG